MKTVKKRGYLRSAEAKPRLQQAKKVVKLEQEESSVDKDLDLILKQATESFEDFSCVVGVIAARQAYLSVKDMMVDPMNKEMTDLYFFISKRIDQLDEWLVRLKKDLIQSPTEEAKMEKEVNNEL